MGVNLETFIEKRQAENISKQKADSFMAQSKASRDAAIARFAESQAKADAYLKDKAKVAEKLNKLFKKGK